MASFKLDYTGEKINNLLSKTDQLFTDKYVSIIIVDSTHCSLDIPLNILDFGRVINVYMPTNNTVKEISNGYININNLGNIKMNGVLKAGKYHNLIYNGSSFDIQVTSINVNGEPIIFTSSGTYTIDKDLTYKILVIGGGGGGGYYSTDTGNTAWGGGGGKVEGTYIPSSSSIRVVVGTAGTNGVGRYENGVGTAGGQSSLETFIAKGGTGGTAKYNDDVVGTTGEGGNLLGYTIAGSVYGRAGDGKSTTPTQGVVILYPLHYS